MCAQRRKRGAHKIPSREGKGREGKGYLCFSLRPPPLTPSVFRRHEQNRTRPPFWRGYNQHRGKLTEWQWRALIFIRAIFGATSQPPPPRFPPSSPALLSARNSLHKSRTTYIRHAWQRCRNGCFFFGGMERMVLFLFCISVFLFLFFPLPFVPLSLLFRLIYIGRWSGGGKKKIGNWIKSRIKVFVTLSFHVRVFSRRMWQVGKGGNHGILKSTSR